MIVNVVAEDDLVGIWDDVGCDGADHKSDSSEQHCEECLTCKGVWRIY